MISPCLQAKIKRSTQLGLTSKAALSREVESNFSFSFWIYMSINGVNLVLKINSNKQCKAIWYLNTHCCGMGQTEFLASSFVHSVTDLSSLQSVIWVAVVFFSLYQCCCLHVITCNFCITHV